MDGIEKKSDSEILRLIALKVERIEAYQNTHYKTLKEHKKKLDRLMYFKAFSIGGFFGLLKQLINM